MRVERGRQFGNYNLGPCLYIERENGLESGCIGGPEMTS